ncbi:hypothetical protein GPECTOR_37g219 [Gonium pectorale]|uniref:Uncharacterized protein n=1 Tax=Gonium pectorale TaxID=33097 RepID=A0A150GBR8_GONPE|nr:hypothetical protein GPECTOR_37g219 [Gonium pectorale]|eukprot:KXZ47213.1 hypothetical protein GPECTOR_37g219 [Gonium pectorale]
MDGKAGSGGGVPGASGTKGGWGHAQAGPSREETEAAIAAAIAIARLSADAAFRSPETRVFRPRSGFTARHAASGATPRAVGTGSLGPGGGFGGAGSSTQVFVGVSAAAAPFAAFSPLATPATTPPGSVRAGVAGAGPGVFGWGSASVISASSAGRAGSVGGGGGGGVGSLFERVEMLLPPGPGGLGGGRISPGPGPGPGRDRAMCSPPRTAGAAPGGAGRDAEFFRRQEALLRKRQAWASAGEKQRLAAEGQASPRAPGAVGTPTAAAREESEAGFVITHQYRERLQVRSSAVLRSAGRTPTGSMAFAHSRVAST